MTGAQIQAAATIIGTLVLLATFLGSMIRAAKRQAERHEEIKVAIRAAGVLEGKASRDDEVALLRSQIDDRDRLVEAEHRIAEAAQRRADAFEARYNDLRDRLGGG